MATRTIGWQGLTLAVPDDWDVTGFSGDGKDGYLRIDDGEEMSVELKWASVGAKEKRAPDIELRVEAYLASLERAAKKKKVAFGRKLGAAPRGVVREGREAIGFTWSGDRKAIGAALWCKASRRVIIAQVAGEPSGKGGLMRVAGDVLASLEVGDTVPGWWLWSLYDLSFLAPSEFALVGQQVMNVYIRLSLACGTEKLTVEQWSIAEMARKGAYLDAWMSVNAKGELAQMKCEAAETELQGHPAVEWTGRPQLGLPYLRALRDGLRELRAPALRFAARAWECEVGNKLYLVQHTRPGKRPDMSEAVAARVRCHEPVASRRAGS